MAEACRIGSCSAKPATDQDESVCIISVFFVFISLVTILADVTTGKKSNLEWFWIPNNVTQWGLY